VEIFVASPSRRPPAEEVPERFWAEPEPTTWPLPYASYYADLPPVGDDGGPTKPCAPHVDWGTSTPLPPASGRPAVPACSGLQPVRYPVCTDEQLGRARRLDAVVGDAVVGEPLKFDLPEPTALRGYLRRSLLRTDGEQWELRLEALSPSGTCERIGISDRPAGSRPNRPSRLSRGGTTFALCHGDASLACCLSALVGADEEIIYETGISPGQLCAVSASAKQDVVHAARRADEAAFTEPAPFCPRVP
jgi:hypothetical protein